MKWIAVNILQANLLFFIKYQVRREGQSDLIMATIFVTAIVALPLWEWASRRWNKRLAYAGGIAFWAIVQMVLITVTAATPLSLLLVLCVLAGIGVSAAHVLPWSILPDAVEWGELQSGQRNEGMFYSLITLTQKIATSIAIPLTLVLLEATGYVANATEQPASALTGIRVLIGPIPAATLCLGILFALFYPLTRESHAELVETLEERRVASGEEPPL